MVEYVKALYGLYVPEKSEGQGMVEYALILALVSIAAIAVLLLLGPQIANVLQQVTNAMGGAGGGGA